ncbi:MAG: hypothetical protein FWF25_00665 [Propionibacteriaceae bacterium]|nr:hypothetical protein [Propionibacteriaceae bacterium]
MIEPFVRCGIKVVFYDIVADDGKILGRLDSLQMCDILYVTDYFGFATQGLDGAVSQYRDRGSVIIYDKTHSLLSSPSVPYDYAFSSIRKWIGVAGCAVLFKAAGPYRLNPPSKTNEDYVALRREAMKRKEAFVEEGRGDKREFLELLTQAEALLARDYVGYSADPESISQTLNADYTSVAAHRRRNAAYLYARLPHAPFLFAKYQDHNFTPLFVPLLIPLRRRELHSRLISEDVYTPIHWPRSEYLSPQERYAESFYEQEISLICDQRYNEEDMERQCGVIEEFLEL